MNILVVGGHFYNKGAHLMLKAVIEEFKKHTKYKLFLSPCAGTKDQISNLGYSTINYPLKHVTDYRGFDIFLKLGSILKYLRESYRGQLPIEDIDVVLDISGFAYSDQWGKGAVLNVNKLISFFKKRQAKYIFLPQAFGPFSGVEIKEYMKKAIENSDLVMARDKNSYQMLIDLTENDKIKQYPDITINLKTEKTSEKVFTNYSCVVPNERMLDQGGEFWPIGKYLSYVNKAINLLLAKTDHKVILLIHDKGEGDTNLANSLKKNYPDNDRVIVYYEEDTMKLKSILGNTNILIGSRFHALVSALSQNIPSMALGWSHKYKMLFDEYNISDFSYDKPNDDLFDSSLLNLLDIEFRKELINKISSSNLTMLRKNQEMWSEVIQTLNS